jgi:hypothetical protein
MISRWDQKVVMKKVLIQRRGPKVNAYANRIVRFVGLKCSGPKAKSGMFYFFFFGAAFLATGFFATTFFFAAGFFAAGFLTAGVIMFSPCCARSRRI